jgi:hypothetical protein
VHAIEAIIWYDGKPRSAQVKRSGDDGAAASDEDDVAPPAVKAAGTVTGADDAEPGALVQGEAGGVRGKCRTAGSRHLQLR